MLRSAGTRLSTAAVVVGVLAALVPATPALASVAASPQPGTGPGMAYDAADGQVVLFGGSAGSTWTWDGSGWTRRTPAHSPPPSGSYYRYGMAYDSADGEVVLFGGIAGDTWTWDGTDWTKRTPAHSPSPLSMHYRLLVASSSRARATPTSRTSPSRTTWSSGTGPVWISTSRCGVVPLGT